jgi:putative transposase
MNKKQTAVYYADSHRLDTEDSNPVRDLTHNEAINCKFCGASHPVKYGYSKGVQCWRCKNCHRKFVDNKAAPRMKTPKEQIAYVLSTYYEGMGFKLICQNLWRQYNSFPSDSTYYEWIDRFTKKAIRESKNDKPQVSKVWIVLVSPLKIGQDYIWFWDIFDIKTRFFLASHMSRQLNQNEALMALTQAVKRVGQLPEVIFTDEPKIRIQGLKLEHNGECRYAVQRGFVNSAGVRILKQFLSHLDSRTTIMKRIRHLESVRRINHGWQVHYNYLRPDEILNKCTPALQANIHRSRLSNEVKTYYINDFWFLWSATVKFNKPDIPNI